MVKGWDSWSTDQGSIPNAASHLWFVCGVPFNLARALRNGIKNTGGPLCVRTPHMQSEEPPPPLRNELAILAGMGDLSTMYSREDNSHRIEDNDTVESNWF